MTQTPDPIAGADEADLAEQRMPLEGPDDRPEVALDEANEADVLEQGSVVAGDDEDDHPRES